MILAFLIKEWKGLLSGGTVVLVLALMGMGSMYSVIKVQSGSISKLESKVDGLKIDLDTCGKEKEQDKITCAAVAEASIEQQKATEEWMNKYEKSVVRFKRNTRLAEERDAEAMRNTRIKEEEAARAIYKAESIEDKIRAFAGSVLGAAIE
ncbi:MAG: hypothetical protein DRR06_13445 [Gammaproteobacteria bacterium]|nr:MAG: hypothetical protein DRR06_13445 [Gammaproteobacteria bacterium]